MLKIIKKRIELVLVPQQITKYHSGIKNEVEIIV